MLSANIAIPQPGICLPESQQQFPGKEAGDWFVLHTRSRQEKAVAHTLSAMGIAHFVPLVRQPRYYGNRKFIVELPLFPSYVFLRGTKVNAFEINQTKRIAQIITVSQQDILDNELRNLFLAVESGAELDPYPYLTAGNRVEVRSGPFRGLQGMVDGRVRLNRIILQVTMLGRAVSLEMDAALLEPIKDDWV